MIDEGGDSMKKEVEPFSCAAILRRPCFYFPLFFFQLSGLIGFILLCVSFSGYASKVGIFAAFILIITGVWAAYELREIGALSEQIKWLRRISKALSHECDKLQGNVNELSDETQELKQNCEDLSQEKGELTAAVSVFTQQNDEYRKIESQLRQQSEEMATNIEQLGKRHHALTATLGKLEEDGEQTKESLNQFSGIQDALEGNAKNQNAHLHEILEKTKHDFNRMNQLAQESDELLFWKRFYAIRRRCGDSMTAKHFRRFQANLRSKFGDVMRELGLDFETLDKDGDGNLDHEELTHFVDVLLESNWKKKNEVQVEAEQQV